MFSKCNHECGTSLPCSHSCTRKCHFNEDEGHKMFKCQGQCTKELSCGHKCTGICSEPCPPCRAQKPFNLPCGHTQYAACSSPIWKIKCNKICGRIMKCGHPCQQKCYEECDPERCVEGSGTLCILCKAPCVAPCNKIEYWAGTRQCSATLGCGHRCSGTCHDCWTSGNGHVKCQSICGADRKCLHKCKSYCKDCFVSATIRRCESYLCSEKVRKLCGKCNLAKRLECHKSANFLCESKFTGKLPCGHESTQLCHKWSPHHSCEIKVSRRCQRCRQMTEGLCGASLVCNHPFTGKLPCGHDSKQKCCKWTEDEICKVKVKCLCNICGREDSAMCSETKAFMCQRQCEELLDCGHQCGGTCRECFSSGHHKICHQQCSRLLACGHPCKGDCNSCLQCESICGSSCSKCVEIVEANCKRCGKTQKVKCFDKDNIECDGPCSGVLECTHMCENTCSSCSSTKGRSHSSCTKKCQRLLACGHECTARCSECSDCVSGCSKRCDEKPCIQNVEKACSRCSRTSKIQCSKLESFSCQRNFTNKLPCGHDSTQPCDKWTKDIPCEVQVKAPCMMCGELKPAPCYQSNKFVCDGPCKALLGCGHTCTGTCKTCSEGHPAKCQEICKKSAVCGHPCKSKCHGCEDCKDTCQASCFKCEEFIKSACRRCGSMKMVHCFEKDIFNCEEPCIGKLKCGHPCRLKCSECPSSEGKSHPPCEENCSKTLICGHKCTQKCFKCSECAELCSEKCSSCEIFTKTSCIYCGSSKSVLCKEKDGFLCNNRCNEVLSCEHICPGNCQKCKSSHQSCDDVCGKLLSCGHRCCTKCINCPWRKGKGSCPQCTKKCKLLCSHGHKCKKKCGEPCNFSCNNRCSWGCEHNKCKHNCSTPCAHRQCEKSCQKNVECRKCRKISKCMGVCGEDCLELCKKCDHQYIVECYKKEDEDYDPNRNDVWVFLNDCRHSIPVKYMDKFVMNHFKTPEEQPLVCPIEKCGTPVLNTGRYVEHTRKNQFSLMQSENDKPKVKKQTRHNGKKNSHESISNKPKNHDLDEAKVNTKNSPKKSAIRETKVNAKALKNVKVDTQAVPEKSTLNEVNVHTQISPIKLALDEVKVDTSDSPLKNDLVNTMDPHNNAAFASVSNTEIGNLSSDNNETSEKNYSPQKEKNNEIADGAINAVESIGPGLSVEEAAHWGDLSTSNTTLDDSTSLPTNKKEVKRSQLLPPPPPIKNMVHYLDGGFTPRFASISRRLEIYIPKT